jgi:1-acyl-sn-glycerol-3-phosphate acyltransferase
VWARRAITLPSLVAVTVLWCLLLPITLSLAVLGDVARGGPWPLVRGATFLTIYLACEIVGVTAAAVVWLVSGPWTGTARAVFLRRNVALQSWWANALYRAAERVYRLRTIVEGDAVVVPGPILVFIRHVSQADTLLPVVYVTRRHGIALRFVLKQELLWDPCLDVVGRRLPNAFIRRGSGESAREIASVQRLMDGLGPRDGVLIYPEGTRFTESKRARVLEKIAQVDPELAARAARLRRVLPPHVGGPLGLLAVDGDVDVVFCAHQGFEAAGSPRDIVGGALVGATIRVRFWRVPRGDIPTEPTERVAWLYAQWQIVDDWLGEVYPLTG